MSQVTRSNVGDIVVVVPRWLIMVVGLVMLLMGLSVSIFLILVGLVTEGVLLSLFVFVYVPFQLLITYMVWRFYWYLMVFGVLISSLLTCTLATGVVRIGANTYSMIRLSPDAPTMPMGNTLAAVVLISFVLALGVVGLVGAIINTLMNSSAPVRKSRLRDEPPPGGQFPSLGDPFWDDPRQQRKRDLWKDDK